MPPKSIQSQVIFDSNISSKNVVKSPHKSDKSKNRKRSTFHWIKWPLIMVILAFSVFSLHLYSNRNRIFRLLWGEILLLSTFHCDYVSSLFLVSQFSVTNGTMMPFSSEKRSKSLNSQINKIFIISIHCSRIN